MNQQRQHRGGNLHQYEGYHNPDHGSLYYNSQSIAESTLQQYDGGGQRGNHAGGGLSTCAGSNGHQYLFNLDNPNFLSRFEVGFRGCFKCG